MTYVLTPLKRLNDSKTRLSNVLTVEERVRLTVAMLKDVVESAVHAKGVESVCIINNDMEVAHLMKVYGVKMLRDPGGGLNNALNEWLKKVEKESESALILPADIPLIEPRDVEHAIQLASHYDMVISPSRDMDGTNALLLKPPTLIPPLFGPNSFRRHMKAAFERDVKVKVFKNKRIGFDVDNPNDLKTLLSAREVHRNLGEWLKNFSLV